MKIVRRIVIAAGIILAGGLLLLLISGQIHVSCVETYFGCGECAGCGDCEGESEKGAALFCADQKGVRCESGCAECEWYPFFFGCATGGPQYYDNCVTPVICGFDLCTFGTVDGDTGYAIPETTALPVKVIETDIVEGRDFTVDSVEYILFDRFGGRYTASSFDELLNSELYKQIKSESGSLAALDQNWCFRFEVVYTISVSTDVKINASITHSSSIYDSIMNHPTSHKYGGYVEAVVGQPNRLTVSTVDLEYIEAIYHHELSEPTFSGKITTFTMGER